MDELLKTLLCCSLGMSAAALILRILSPLLARRYAAKTLRALWIVILIGFCLPFRPNITPQIPIPVKTVSRTIVITRQSPTISAQPVQSAQTAAPTAHTQRTETPPIHASDVLFAVYMLGFFATLGIELTRHLRFMRLVRRWQHPADSPEQQALYADACRKMNSRRPPELMLCPAVRSPMLVGLFRPRILLPEAGTPDSNAASAILCHELAHFQHRDIPVSLLALLARAMHWFNPAVYLSCRTEGYYAELACDDDALRDAAPSMRAAYGQAILMALRQGKPQTTALTTPFTSKKQMLKRRLMHMMSPAMKRTGLVVLFLVLLMSLWLGAGFVLADSVQTSDTMTLDEMNAVYAESTAKMNTVAHYRYGRNWLDAYEADMLARGETPNDQVGIYDLPQKGEMRYDDALAYAYQQITEKYGTPQSELEQMGVYPTFYRYSYLDENPEWEFYITPRRNCNIETDHVYPDAGEYRVDFDAVTGELVYCIWYLEPDNRPDDMRWSEAYSIANNPEQPSYEMTPKEFLPYLYDYSVENYAANAAVSAGEALLIAQSAFMEENALPEEEFSQYFYATTPYFDESGCYELYLVPQQDAPVEWSGLTAVYGIDGGTGKILYHHTYIESSAISFEQRGDKTAGLTWTVEDVYWDGSLLSMRVKTTPNDERYGVCPDVLGDYADYSNADDVRSKGYIPLGSYCEAELYVNSRSADSPVQWLSDTEWYEGNAATREWTWQVPPTFSMEDFSIQLTCGVMETPGQPVNGELSTYAIPTPYKNSTDVRELFLQTDSGVQTNRLRELIITQTASAASVYLYYDAVGYAPAIPFAFSVQDSRNIHITNGYDEQKQLNYIACGSADNALDLSTNTLSLKDLEHDEMLIVHLDTGVVESEGR